MSDSVQPHRWQPTRLLHPWDFPGKQSSITQTRRGLTPRVSSLFHFPDIRSVTKSFFLLQVLYSVLLVPPMQRCKSGICRRVPVPRGPLSAPQPCPLGHPKHGAVPASASASAKSLQSCPSLCNPIDGSLPGSSILGIFRVGRAWP